MMSYAFEGELAAGAKDREKARNKIKYIRDHVQDGYITKRQTDRLWIIFEPYFGTDWKRFLFLLSRHTLDDLPKVWANYLISWSQKGGFRAEMEYLKDYWHYLQAD